VAVKDHNEQSENRVGTDGRRNQRGNVWKVTGSVSNIKRHSVSRNRNNIHAKVLGWSPQVRNQRRVTHWNREEKNAVENENAKEGRDIEESPPVYALLESAR